MFSPVGLGTRSFLDFGNAGGTKKQEANVVAIESIRLPYRPGQSIVLSLRERNVKACVEDVERGVVPVKWISGLPLEAIRNAESRKQFFSESFPTLSPIGTHYRLTFFPKMLGGVDEGRLGPEVLVKLREAIRKAREANLHDQDVIGLIGVTGVGKSTIINHLLGLQMGFREEELGLNERGEPIQILPDRVVVEGGLERATIGHKLATSQTLYAEPYQLCPGTSLIDCGGFLDTHGASEEIAVVSSLKLTLEAAKTVRLGICVDYNVLKTNRATSFFDTLNIALRRLLVDYTTAQVFFIFTRAPKNPAGRLPTKESIMAIFRKMIDELGGPQASAAETLNYVIRENGRYLFVYDPLNNRHRDELLQLAMNTQPIAQPKISFNAAYSATAMLKILEEVVSIAVCGNDLFRRTAAAQETVNRRADTVAQLRGEVQRKQEAISVLKGDATPKQYAQAEAKLKAENERTIREVEAEIGRLNSEIHTILANIEALTERASNLDKEGEREELYWSDPFEQKGINLETVNITTNSWKKSGFLGFGGSSGTTESRHVAYDRRPIDKDFRYRGPEIARIEKTPSDPRYWSNEVREVNVYSIHYRTGDGEDANAELKIFVKKKHSPEHISKKLELTQNIALENQRIADLKTQIHQANMRQQTAQHGLEIQGNKQEKIAQHELDVAKLQQTIREIETEIQRFREEIHALEVEIQGKAEDFQFLNDYLKVCQDNQFRNRREIVDFQHLQQVHHA